MDQFLLSLPKPVLALAAIAIGFFLIVYFNPPQTVCDSQMLLFREAEATFLYGSSPHGISHPPAIKEMFDQCQASNDPGGCFALLNGLKKMSIDLRNIPHQCAETAAGEGEIKNWLLKSLELMTQIAWGEKAPISFTDKHAWFDSSDIALFCSLKENASRILSEEFMYDWRRSIIHQLPQADKMEGDEAWRKSLFSTACDNYR